MREIYEAAASLAIERETALPWTRFPLSIRSILRRSSCVKMKVQPNPLANLKPFPPGAMDEIRADQKKADKASMDRAKATAAKYLAEAKSGVPLTPAEKEMILARAREIEKERAAEKPAKR
jgi:hypothetical protein